MRIRALGFSLLLASASASAAVVQPGGVAIPELPEQAELDLVTQSWAYQAATEIYADENGDLITPNVLLYGQHYSPPAFPQFVDGDAITLAGLFKWRGEAIDWQADATSPSGAFVPACPVTVELLLKGGDCEASLAWYNVADPSSPVVPAASQLFEIVPSDVNTLLDCQAPLTYGFCPLAWDNRDPRNQSLVKWTPHPITVDIRADVRYLGGAIGFALLLPNNVRCGSTRYSVRAHNTRNTANEPFVGALVYGSVQEPSAVYLAFEDGVMKPTDWTDGGKTRGDYNDYVAFVSGCFGGSTPIDNGGAGGADNGGEAPSSGGEAPSSGGEGEAPSSAGESQGTGGSASAGTAGKSSLPAEGGEASGAPEGGHSNDHETIGSASASDESRACGCRVAGRSSWPSAFLLAGAVGALWVQRRRTRR